jgi:hypothetical protein
MHGWLTNIHQCFHCWIAPPTSNFDLGIRFGGLKVDCLYESGTRSACPQLPKDINHIRFLFSGKIFLKLLEQVVYCAFVRVHDSIDLFIACWIRDLFEIRYVKIERYRFHLCASERSGCAKKQRKHHNWKDYFFVRFWHDLPHVKVAGLGVGKGDGLEKGTRLVFGVRVGKGDATRFRVGLEKGWKRGRDSFSASAYGTGATTAEAHAANNESRPLFRPVAPLGLELCACNQVQGRCPWLLQAGPLAQG